MSLRDPKVQRLLLTAVLCGVALWSYFLTDLLPFGYPRRAREQRELRTQQEKLAGELEKARRTVSSLPQLEREHGELQSKWKQAEALLPPDKEVAQLLTQITLAGEQAGVTFELFKPGEPKPQEFYNENPVDIKVRGGFHQVGVFLARLANLSRIVNVAQLQLEGLDQSKGSKDSKPNQSHEPRTDQTLRASFVATAYSLRDAEPSVPQGPPAEQAAARRSLKDRLVQQLGSTTGAAKGAGPQTGER